MTAQFSSALIVVASIVLYQVGMKLVPHSFSPITVLLTFYSTALICTLVAAQFLPADQPRFSMANFSWAAVVVGVAIVGIELGYLLMYRSDWHLAIAPLVTMGAATMLLLPISLLVFNQPWSPRYLFGLAFCLCGLYLLAPQK